MFYMDDQCIFCDANRTPIRLHWCNDIQIFIALLVLQYKFVGGNISGNKLNKELSKEPINMHPVRRHNTMKFVRYGDIDECTWCYQDDKDVGVEICDNRGCEGCDHMCGEAWKSCKHNCDYGKSKCQHLCEPCTSDCKDEHSFVKEKLDILDPRKTIIWISNQGLNFLDDSLTSVLKSTKFDKSSVLDVIGHEGIIA